MVMPEFPSLDALRPGSPNPPDVPLFPIGAQAPKAGKPRNPALLAALAVLVFGMLSALPGCHREPPEAALHATIAGMQVAAEAHDTDSLFEPIAEDFAGSEGMDRQAFHRYVTFMGLRNQQIGAQLGPLEVKLFGDRATVVFTAGISGGAGWMPERGQVYDVVTGWRLDGGKWKLISAKWTPKL